VFYQFLNAYNSEQAPWTLVYPAEGLINEYVGGPLIVDVGGGKYGKDLEIFRAAHPESGPSLVLQDLPGVPEAGSNIQCIGRSFFESQPTVGARAYYMHSIIHDWNDEDARRILTRIREAMTPGYSKLLVNDIVLMHGDLSSRTTSIDIHMMTFLSAKERTMESFRELFKQVGGLKLTGTWQHPSSVTTILELERT
jgi:hypothetical protein